MVNPTMSLLQAQPKVDLSKAAAILKQAPSMMQVAKPQQTKIEAPSFVEKYKATLADDIVRQNAVEGRYSSSPDSKSMLNYIASYESPGAIDPYKAVNKDTGAFGKYQFIPKYAKPYADRLGVDVDALKANPNLQDKAASLKLQDLYKELDAYGIPATRENVYLGWQEGAKGLSDLIQNKLPGGSYKALDLNLPQGVARTPEAFLGYWRDKL